MLAGYPGPMVRNPNPSEAMTVPAMLLIGLGLVCLGTMPDAGPRKDGWS